MVVLAGAPEVPLLDAGAAELVAGAAVVVVEDLFLGHFVKRRIFSKKSGACLVSFLWHSATSGLNLQ